MGNDDWKDHWVVIGKAEIESLDSFQIIDPLWWAVSIYDGPEVYERDLARFSEPQRFVHAIHWYEAEVCNGGHDQFYSNSTGIVWRNALAGCEAAGIVEVAAIIEESAARLGRPPPLDRDERNALLDKIEPDFDDLDKAFYKLDLGDRLLRYIRANAEQFYFQGVVRKPPPIGDDAGR